MKIKIIKNIATYEKREPFILCDKPITIEYFDSYRGNYDSVYAILKNASVSKCVKVVENSFVVPVELLFAGVLSCEIVFVCNGQDVRRVRVEELVLKSLNSKFEAIPQVQELNLKIEQYKAENERLQSRFEEVKKKVETLTKLVGNLYNVEIKIGE